MPPSRAVFPGELAADFAGFCLLKSFVSCLLAQDSMKSSPLHCSLASSIVLLVSAFTGPVSHAGLVAAPYQIGTWEGFRPAAISYTFDDDCPNQYAEAVPMFHAAGLKMTLFTVTSWETTWTSLQNAATWGDEIASHTVTHVDLTTVSSSQLTNELGTSQSTINNGFLIARPAAMPRSMASSRIGIPAG